MDTLFSDRIADVPRSFIREILKTTLNSDVISFAGGLPNRDLFPVREIREAADVVLDKYGSEVLQYGTSEGYLPLRQWIARRYASHMNLEVDADDILITTGSQQGLDLVGKTFINENDHVVIEEPGYLGAIQAFSLYRPVFEPVTLNFDGLAIDQLNEKVQSNRIKLLYTVPNFQNPSGISHSNANRNEVVRILSGGTTILVEDNPYGELQFSGEKRSSYYRYLPHTTIMFGSFSKIFAPSLRIGWLVAPGPLIEKLLVAKQASDLHTDYLAQRILYQYLCDNDIDRHITRIRAVYQRQKEAMKRAILNHFPAVVRTSDPDGGMFLWAVLPEGVSARMLFDAAILQNVAFVPGDPFYVNRRDVNTMRLNFSCVDEATIERGIAILGRIIRTFCE